VSLPSELRVSISVKAGKETLDGGTTLFPKKNYETKPDQISQSCWPKKKKNKLTVAK